MAAASTVPTVPPIMKGGSREHSMDVLRKYAKPIEVYIGLILGVAIVYVKQIPEYIKDQADSLLGRLLLFLLAILLTDMYSWMYGLLAVLFIALLIAQAPRSNRIREAFQDKQFTKKVPKDRKWFVEEVFHENPESIEDELVSTTAIQDNTASSSSTTSSK